MKILVLSFYYKPDLCAGSFRATPLVEELHKVAPAGSSIDVVTTLPNRYSTFTSEATGMECRPGVTIHRIALPNHQSGMLDQSKAFLVFLMNALKIVKTKDYDIVFATSSRLMTAVLGAWIACQKKSRLYLDIRDIFVDTIKDVLPKKASFLLKPIFSSAENWAITRADKVNLVSAGFASYFTTRYPDKKFSYYTNGIDDEFLAVVPTQSNEAVEKDVVSVLYAGNMGEGQGLHAIVPGLAKRMESRVRFKVIGDGGRKKLLEDQLLKLGVKNVVLLPPMNRDDLLKEYHDADILFLHLNDYEAFKKVLPSKIFEYAALGKPMWAGVSGYAAEFITSEVTNAVVFKPCDVDSAVQSFSGLRMQDSPRSAFVEKYARANISKKIAEDVLAVANGGL